MLDLVDIGANLTHDSFDADRDSVLEQAFASGVGRMVITGTSVNESRRAVELAASHRALYATAGIHPHHARDFDDSSIEALRELLASKDVVAVGECGLDYFRDFSPRDSQRLCFEAQLELAAQSEMPVFLHQRDAHEDFEAIVRSARPGLAGGVAHCFTGGPAELEAYLALDLYIGVTGWVCDERRGEELRRALPSIPADRLLIETDAPYLLPRDLRPAPRSRRNEPRYLPHVLERIAAEIGREPGALARATTENAIRLFGLS